MGERISYELLRQADTPSPLCCNPPEHLVLIKFCSCQQIRTSSPGRTYKPSFYHYVQFSPQHTQLPAWLSRSILRSVGNLILLEFLECGNFSTPTKSPSNATSQGSLHPHPLGHFVPRQNVSGFASTKPRGRMYLMKL